VVPSDCAEDFAPPFSGRTLWVHVVPPEKEGGDWREPGGLKSPTGDSSRYSVIALVPKA